MTFIAHHMTYHMNHLHLSSIFHFSAYYYYFYSFFYLYHNHLHHPILSHQIQHPPIFTQNYLLHNSHYQKHHSIKLFKIQHIQVHTSSFKKIIYKFTYFLLYDEEYLLKLVAAVEAAYLLKLEEWVESILLFPYLLTNFLSSVYFFA